MSNRNRFAVAKNVLNGNNLSISAPCPTAQGKWSTLNFRVINGNPRITIYTNDPEDKIEYGTINVRFSPIMFQGFLELWKEAIDQSPGWKRPMDIEEYDWTGGERSKKPEIRVRLIVGKDNDGVISIMAVDMKYKNRPRIKFEIGAPRFLSVLGTDGAPAEKSDLSILFSRAWIRMLEHMTNQLCVDTWKEPQKRNQDGGGYQNRSGGGGYSNQQNQSQDQSNDFLEEEIPF